MEKKKLKILIFNHRAASIGGSEYSTLAIAQALKQRGHHVVYASGGGSLVERLEQSGITHYHFPLRRFLPRLLQFSIPSILKLAKVVKEEEIDCIHCFQYFNLLASCGAQIMTGVPIVWTVLGPYGAGSYNFCRVPHFHGQILACCAEFRDQTIAKNPGLSADDIPVIPNRIDFQRYRPGLDTTEFRAQFNLKKGGLKVVMVSRFHPSKMKAISSLIDATPYILERAPQTQVIFVGGGVGFDGIQRRAKQLNQSLGREAVILTGARDDVPQILNIADVVVGIGRSALEGMACQKPAVILGARGFAGIVQPETVDQIAYFNFAGRNVSTPVPPDRLAEAIVRLLTDPDQRSALGKFSMDYVLREFDVKFGAERLEKIYGKVIANHTNRRWRGVRLFLSLMSSLTSASQIALTKSLSDIKDGQAKSVLPRFYSPHKPKRD